MATTTIGNQLRNSQGLPLDSRSRVAGSMAESFANIPTPYEGMVVYSVADKKHYKVTEVEGGKIKSYEPFSGGGVAQEISVKVGEVNNVQNLGSVARDGGIIVNNAGLASGQYELRYVGANDEALDGLGSIGQINL